MLRYIFSLALALNCFPTLGHPTPRGSYPNSYTSSVEFIGMTANTLICFAGSLAPQQLTLGQPQCLERLGERGVFMAVDFVEV